MEFNHEGIALSVGVVVEFLAVGFGMRPRAMPQRGETAVNWDIGLQSV